MYNKLNIYESEHIYLLFPFFNKKDGKICTNGFNTGFLCEY